MLTEDMSNPMALTDKWTLLMLAMLAAQIVTAVLNKKASELDEEEEEAEAGAEAANQSTDSVRAEHKTKRTGTA